MMSSIEMWMLLHILISLVAVSNAQQQSLWMVNLQSDPMGAVALAVRVCAGLFNRDDETEDAVYLLESESDQGWVDDIVVKDGYSVETIEPKEFLTSECLGSIVIKGYISYDFSAQQLLLPNIITIAAVLDAVPLDVDVLASLPSTALPLVFDAVTQFLDWSALDATRFVYEEWGEQTTAMSKMNPGWETTNVLGVDNQLDPQLTGTPELGLTDYIVKERLFNFFLWYGCKKIGKEGDFLSYMAANSPFWPNPIPVWGYDTSFLVFGGYLYEANTLCADSKNMGSVPSRNVNNLSYFSRKPPIAEPLTTVDVPALTYDPTKTYIGFVVGDGDNLAFVKDGEASRKEWMKERVAFCNSQPPPCFPLSWSLSPHLLYAAPDILEWYYEQAIETGADSFVLPPSGHLYSYPGSMPDEAQAEFIRLSERDAQLMDTNGIVGWEVATTWLNAFRKYFPLYTANNIVNAIFATNVPYPVPIITAAFSDTYQVINNNLVVFEPQSWRGTDDRDGTPFFFSVAKKAEQINTFSKGSISYLYLTSDGGFEIKDAIDLVGELNDHVVVVDARQLGSLALERERSLGGNWYDPFCDALPFLPC